MKRNFDSVCLQREPGIPRSSLGSVETASQGIGVGECRIHNVRVGKAEHELSDRDPGQKARLTQQSVVGRALEFKQSSQLIGILSQSVEYGLFLVSRRNQSMSVILKNTRNSWKHLPPTPARIEELSHSQHGGHPASDHIGEWRVSLKHGVGIGQLNPAIGKPL